MQSFEHKQANKSKCCIFYRNLSFYKLVCIFPWIATALYIVFRGRFAQFLGISILTAGFHVSSSRLCHWVQLFWTKLDNVMALEICFCRILINMRNFKRYDYYKSILLLLLWIGNSICWECSFGTLNLILNMSRYNVPNNVISKQHWITTFYQMFFGIKM